MCQRLKQTLHQGFKDDFTGVLTLCPTRLFIFVPWWQQDILNEKNEVALHSKNLFKDSRRDKTFSSLKCEFEFLIFTQLVRL